MTEPDEKRRIIKGLQELCAHEKAWSQEHEGGLYWIHRRLQQFIEELEEERFDCCSKCQDIVYQINICTGDCQCHEYIVDAPNPNEPGVWPK